MLLRSISIDGLRGYAEKRTLNFAIPNGNAGSGLTVIVGPNNSGKSTLVEIFRFRRQYSAASFNLGMRNRKTDSVSLEFDFADHSESIRSIRPGSSETVVEGANLHTSPVYFVPSRRYFSPAFGKGAPSARTDFINNYSASTNDRSPQISQFEGRLIQIERDQSKFNEVMRKVIPDLLSWSIDQYETGQYFLKFSSNEKSHSSEGVGEGVISAFVIVAALYDSNAGDVIVIDEPELLLHPQIQKRMMKLFEDYTKDRQIVIATHSPYFITRSAIIGGLTVCRAWDRDGAIDIAYLSSVDEGSPLKRLASYNINNPHVFGLDAREVFFLEDGVVVFEGQEDVVLWSEVSSQLDGPEFQIFGWGAGGAENIKNVLSVLRGLGFRKVVAILDNDKKSESQMISMQFPDYKSLTIPGDDVRTKKAAPARKEKTGLLDEQMIIRPEYVQATRALIKKMADALAK